MEDMIEVARHRAADVSKHQIRLRSLKHDFEQDDSGEANKAYDKCEGWWFAFFAVSFLVMCVVCNVFKIAGGGCRVVCT